MAARDARGFKLAIMCHTVGGAMLGFSPPWMHELEAVFNQVASAHSHGTPRWP